MARPAPWRASMRPRHFCKGRCASAECHRASPWCFNEAPALLPGKILGLEMLLEPVRVASMRPQHFCRGRFGRHNQQRLPAPLASMRPRHFRWGRSQAGELYRLREHSFNEASAFLPGKIPGACLRHQSRDSFNEAPAFLSGTIASLISQTPTRSGSFNEALTFLHEKIDYSRQWAGDRNRASMRPQVLCRGRLPDLL